MSKQIPGFDVSPPPTQCIWHQMDMYRSESNREVCLCVCAYVCACVSWISKLSRSRGSTIVMLYCIIKGIRYATLEILTKGHVIIFMPILRHQLNSPVGCLCLKVTVHGQIRKRSRIPASQRPYRHSCGSAAAKVASGKTDNTSAKLRASKPRENPTVRAKVGKYLSAPAIVGRISVSSWSRRGRNLEGLLKTLNMADMV
jgi:hypothetical protein